MDSVQHQQPVSGHSHPPLTREELWGRTFLVVTAQCRERDLEGII